MKHCSMIKGILCGIGLSLVWLAEARTIQALATLEIPAPGSHKSGIGIAAGWACNTTDVLLVFDGEVEVRPAQGVGWRAISFGRIFALLSLLQGIESLHRVCPQLPARLFSGIQRHAVHE